MFRTVVPLIALSLAACTQTTTADSAGGSSTGAAVRERIDATGAVYRFMFANNASAIKNGAAAYCVGTGARPNTADPSPEVLAAIGPSTPPVVPASSCTAGERATDAGGRPALIFTLDVVGCDSERDCLFQGGYYEGNLSASSGRYRARRVGSTWQVTPEGPQAIS